MTKKLSLLPFAHKGTWQPRLESVTCRSRLRFAPRDLLSPVSVFRRLSIPSRRMPLARVPSLNIPVFPQQLTFLIICSRFSRRRSVGHHLSFGAYVCADFVSPFSLRSFTCHSRRSSPWCFLTASNSIRFLPLFSFGPVSVASLQFTAQSFLRSVRIRTVHGDIMWDSITLCRRTTQHQIINLIGKVHNRTDPTLVQR